MCEKVIISFWNNPKQVMRFAKEKPSKYLLTFFSKIPDPETKKVLDLGCGGGRNTEMLSMLGFSVYACDLHKAMVNFTKKRMMKLNKKTAKKIILASMLSLPYSDNKFDYIISNGIFHNTSSLKELKMAIKESARVLKNYGCLVLNMFSSKTIDPHLKPMKNRDSAYITSQGLPLILIPKELLIKILATNKLYPILNINETKVIIKTGKRSVLRGVFQKRKNK